MRRRDVPVELTDHPDAGAVLSWAISTSRPGTTWVLPEERTFHGRVHWLPGVEDVHVEGHGSEFVGQPSNERSLPHALMHDARGCSATGLRVRGDATIDTDAEGSWDATREAQHGFEHRASQDCVFLECEARNVWGDFAYARGEWDGSELVLAERIGWDGLKGRGANRQGLAIGGGVRDWQLADFDLAHIRRSCFDVEPAGPAGIVEHGMITDGIVADYRLMWLASHGRGPVDDLHVSHVVCCDGALTVDAKADSRYGTGRRAGLVIEDCAGVAPYGSRREHLMRFIRYDGVTIQRVTQARAEHRDTPCAVRAIDCTDIDVDHAGFTGFDETLCLGWPE